jgi:hypothetical protein
MRDSLENQAPEIDTSRLIPTGSTLPFDNPLQLLKAVYPEFVPNAKQAAILLMIGGRVNPADLTEKLEFDEEHALKLAIPAANGSGKDLVIIAAASVWFIVKGARNRVIVTSSSDEQIKNQTEPHIRRMCEVIQKKFACDFRIISKHIVCTRTASEIKLTVTNDPGRAEGYHPWVGGQMMFIVNEAKTITNEMFDAFQRCSGYSYWFEVSSPGMKSGRFYQNVRTGTKYPARITANRFYTLKISAYDCPHISRAHIAWCKEHMPAAWVASSIDGEFMDSEIDVVIPFSLVESCDNVIQIPGDYAIALDSAAGRDETCCKVRCGNYICDALSFVEKNTVQASLRLHEFLIPYWDKYTHFWADDGGISRAYIDNLQNFGWRIRRIRNEAAPRNKKEFLNRGCEDYFHVKRLLAQKLIVPPKDEKTRSQLSSRRYDNLQHGGKFRLEPKDEHKKRLGESPDHSDTYVLAFGSYNFDQATDLDAKHKLAREAQPKGFSEQELEERLCNPKRLARMELNPRHWSPGRVL